MHNQHPEVAYRLARETMTRREDEAAAWRRHRAPRRNSAPGLTRISAQLVSRLRTKAGRRVQAPRQELYETAGNASAQPQPTSVGQALAEAGTLLDRFDAANAHRTGAKLARFDREVQSTVRYLVAEIVGALCHAGIETHLTVPDEADNVVVGARTLGVIATRVGRRDVHLDEGARTRIGQLLEQLERLARTDPPATPGVNRLPGEHSTVAADPRRLREPVFAPC